MLQPVTEAKPSSDDYNLLLSRLKALNNELARLRTDYKNDVIDEAELRTRILSVTSTVTSTGLGQVTEALPDVWGRSFSAWYFHVSSVESSLWKTYWMSAGVGYTSTKADIVKYLEETEKKKKDLEEWVKEVYGSGN